MKNSKQSGFTLVELAIVLMIIGLLIGGILRGQELMRNAEITTTVQQVKAYQGAMVTFRDAYSALPGDLSTADARLPGCQVGNANSCQKGDGNGIIGITESYAPWMAIDAAVTSENTQFWKHLGLSHLISGVTPNATTPEWGKTHPASKIGGGFFIRYATWNNTEPGMGKQAGLYLVTRRTVTGDWDCGVAGSVVGACSLSPQRAAQIDRKMDNGVALSGDVIAISASWTTGCGLSNQGENGPTGYNEAKTTNACDMMFHVD